VVWNDNRFSIDYAFPTYDVFAQRGKRRGYGAVDDRRRAGLRPAVFSDVLFIATDGAGGALVTWSDAALVSVVPMCTRSGSAHPRATVGPQRGRSVHGSRIQNGESDIADGAGGAVISWTTIAPCRRTILFATGQRPPAWRSGRWSRAQSDPVEGHSGAPDGLSRCAYTSVLPKQARASDQVTRAPPAPSVAIKAERLRTRLDANRHASVVHAPHPRRLPAEAKTSYVGNA